MAYSPRRLREILILLVLAAMAGAPAHARRNRLGTTNPNPENQTQVQPQPVPTQPYNNGGTSGATQYNGGYVPSSAPPDSRIQIQQPPKPQQYPNPAGFGAAVVSRTAAPGAGVNPQQSSAASASQPAQTARTYAPADQYPPKPPRVSFRNGQLSISAENSTLPDILSAIHQRTGAAMELPTTISNERVAVKLGPATTGEVMAALLNGSHFDYIVLNRPEDPSSPERIILREKIAAGDPNAPNNGSPYNNGYVASAQPPSYQPSAEVQEVPETTPDEEPQPQPGVVEVATPPPGEENTAPKTPEQLLEELRRLQQQRGQPPQQITPPQPPLVDNSQPQ